MKKRKSGLGELDTRKLLVILLPLSFFFFISCSGCISQTNPTNQTNIASITVIPHSTFIQPTHVEVECPTLENASPYIIINPIGVRDPGDVVEINGTTNLDINSKIKIEISESQVLQVATYSSPNLNPTLPKYQYFYHTGYPLIQNGTCGRDFWAYKIVLPNDHIPSFAQYDVSVGLSNISYNAYSFIKINLDPPENITGVK